MDASESEALLYTTLSEISFTNQRINIKTVKNILLYLIIFLVILGLKLDKQWHIFPVIKIIPPRY